MEFIKKQSLGFYIDIVAIVIALIAIVKYILNCQTDYFKNLGVDSTVLISFIVAVVAMLIFVAGHELMGQKIYFDICPVIAGALATVSTILFVSSRVNGIAAIITFNNNASTMADLQNTIVSFVFCFLAMILIMVGSFFKIVKE